MQDVGIVVGDLDGLTAFFGHPSEARAAQQVLPSPTRGQAATAPVRRIQARRVCGCGGGRREWRQLADVEPIDQRMGTVAGAELQETALA